MERYKIMDELAVMQNRINELETEINLLKTTLSEKEEMMFGMLLIIEENSAYVENWKDSDGYEFSGRIYWSKRSGSLYKGYGEVMEGEWDVNGNITEGELTRNGKLIEKWEDGVAIYDEDIDDEDIDDEDIDDEDIDDEDIDDDELGEPPVPSGN